MYTLFETTEVTRQLLVRKAAIETELIRELPLAAEAVNFPADTDLHADAHGNHTFLRLKEGNLNYRLNDKILYVLEAGDLIGLEDNASQYNPVISSDFAVICDIFKIESLRGESVGPEKTRLLMSYYQLLLAIHSHMLADLLKPESGVHPEFRHFSAGDVIIEQGSSGSEVYTLVEGHAEVFVDSVKVGEIVRDEIFGMIAAFTGTARTATVRAAGNCMAVVVSKDSFFELMNQRPQTVLQLIQDMSNTIVDLNNRVVSLKG